MSAPDKTARTILFVDFEASGLEACSFPVEIGWCTADGEGETHLIRPEPNWTAWSHGSEKIHGITRKQLQVHGKPPEAVARRVDSAFSPRKVMVLSNAPDFDQLWLNRLFTAGRIWREVRLSDPQRNLEWTVQATPPGAAVPDRAAPDLVREIFEAGSLAAEASGPSRHRALPDAKRNGQEWADLLRRAELVAACWRVVAHKKSPGEAKSMGRRAASRFERTNGADLLPPFLLKKRLPGSRRERLGAILELPSRSYRSKWRVTAWTQTPSARQHDGYLAPFSNDELRLARRLVRQLRVPWEESPLSGLPRKLAAHVRRLRGARNGGRWSVTLRLLRAEALPKAHWQGRREEHRRRRSRQWQAGVAEPKRT